MKRKDNEYWRFTFTMLRPNEFKKTELDHIPALSYLIYGYETGNVSGVEHLQGYFETYLPTTKWVLKSILKSCFVEVARESKEINKIYCSKSAYFKEIDNSASVKSKSDLNNLTLEKQN